MDMRDELDPENGLTHGRGDVMDGVTTTILAGPILGVSVPAASSELVGAGRQSADLPSTVLVLSIRERLEHHSHFRGRASLLGIELVDGTIVLSGRLPSYYLKQLLQEAIVVMPGVLNVDNQVHVLWPTVPLSGVVDAAGAD